MINYFKHFLLAVVLILGSCMENEGQESLNRVIHVMDKGYLIDSLYKVKYDELINYIKAHEGYSATLYYCPAGYPTIGYGHLVKNDEYNEDTYLTETQAERLLVKDFNRAIELAHEYSPELNKLQCLAIGHFIFGRGVGTYDRSNLRKLINSDSDSDEIKNEFNKHSYYRSSKSGKLIFSSNANQMRMTEYGLYKRGRSIEENYKGISELTDTEIIYYSIDEKGNRKLM